MQESFHKEDLTAPNTDALDGSAPDWVRQKPIEPKRDIDKSTIIFEDLITSFSVTNRIRQNISKAREDPDHTLVLSI